MSLVRYVPIPRIEYQDADIDLVIENLIFESDNFLPNKVRVDSNSRAEFTNAYTFESEYSNTTTVRIDGFRVWARDISYAFRKKSGFLQFEDKGLLNVYVFIICIELIIVGSKRCFRGNQINGKSPNIKQRRFLLPSRQSLRNNQPFQLLPPTIQAQCPCNPLIPLRQTHHPRSTPTSP